MPTSRVGVSRWVSARLGQAAVPLPLFLFHVCCAYMFMCVFLHVGAPAYVHAWEDERMASDGIPQIPPTWFSKAGTLMGPGAYGLN